MKKLNKILLGGLICATSFVLTGRVSAKAAVEYPSYKSGDTILYDKQNNHICVELYANCESYTVTEDSETDNLNVNVVNKNKENDKLSLSKIDLSVGFVASSKEKTDYNLTGCFGSTEDEKCEYVKNPENNDKITKIRYFLYGEHLNLIKNAQKFDNFQFFGGWGIDETNSVLTIPEDVNITVPYIFNKNVVNNGTIHTGYIDVTNLDGTGIINLDYDVFVGDNEDEVQKVALRFSVNNIKSSKIRVELESKIVKEGTIFGYFNKSKTLAEQVINDLNKILGQSLNGYEVQLKSKNDLYGSGDYYYGVLVKKVSSTLEDDNSSTKDNSQVNKSDIKNDVKNPSTGDATGIIAIIVIISGALATIALKKVKQR